MIEARSRRIGRDKLAKLTGDDHETIKFLEGTQADAAASVGGANEAMDAATAAQSAAQQAAQDAAAAQSDASAAQSTANQASTDAGTAQSTAASALSLAQDIEDDYISKTEVVAQAVVSTFQAVSYLVGGIQVVGARINGWTAATGTPNYGAFNGNTTYAAGATYLQSEASAVAAALTETRQRVVALEKALRDHGLIN